MTVLVLTITVASFPAHSADAAPLQQDPDIGSVTAEKIWIGAGADPKPETWFKLYRSDGNTVTPVENADVKLVPPNATEGKYKVTWENIQLKHAHGAYAFIVKETNELGEDYTPPGFIKTEFAQLVTNTAAVTLSVKKEWKGGGPQGSVSFQFYESIEGSTPTEKTDGIITLDGTVDEKEPKAWTGSLQLPAFTSDGKEITYTVEEVQIPDQYTTERKQCTIPGSDPVKPDPHCWIFTNTYNPPPIATTSYTANKVWSANTPDPHPNVTFQLYRGIDTTTLQPLTSEPRFTQTIRDGDPLTVKWDNLPMYGPNGIPYLYSFREEALPDYTQSYSEDGHTVTNTYDPKVNITVNKFWTGSQYPRPYIEVKLYRNGVEISTVPLTTNTSYTWANLDRVDENGKPYVYTVDEPVAPSGYIKTVSGYNITNTYVGSAYTGDDRSVRNYAAILFVSLLAIAVLLYFGSKPRQMRP